MWARTGRKQEEWTQITSAGGIVRDSSSFGVGVSHVICAISKGCCLALSGTTFQRVGPGKAHTQWQGLQFLIAPHCGGCLLGAWLCWWEYSDPPWARLFAQLFPSTTLLRKLNHWMNLDIWMRSYPQRFSPPPFFFHLKTTQARGWETIYLDCGRGVCWLG